LTPLYFSKFRFSTTCNINFAFLKTHNSLQSNFIIFYRQSVFVSAQLLCIAALPNGNVLLVMEDGSLYQLEYSNEFCIPRPLATGLPDVQCQSLMHLSSISVFVLQISSSLLLRFFN